jgi:hypothetical protein
VFVWGALQLVGLTVPPLTGYVEARSLSAEALDLDEALAFPADSGSLVPLSPAIEPANVTLPAPSFGSSLTWSLASGTTSSSIWGCHASVPSVGAASGVDAEVANR